MGLIFFLNDNPEGKMHAGTGRQVEVRVAARVLVLRLVLCFLFLPLQQDSLNSLHSMTGIIDQKALGAATEDCGISLTSFIFPPRFSNAQCSSNSSASTSDL